MDDDQRTFLTEKGLKKLTNELRELKGKRKDIAQRIQEAKELGDLSENAEYAEAKNNQAFAEGRILEIEATLKSATVVGKSDTKSGTVGVGSSVTCESDAGTTTYAIVGANEADPTKGKISNESPLGQAFIGKTVGDTVEIEVPKGARTFKILSVD